MSSLNQVNLIGRVGRDPEMKTFPSGGQVANLSLATTEKWKDKQSGETKEATEWHRCVFNGRLAEVVTQYAKKGVLIYVSGSIKTRKYNDKDGNEKQVVEIQVFQMQLLSKPADGGGSAPAAAPARAPAPRPSGGGPTDFDDIPFAQHERGFII